MPTTRSQALIAESIADQKYINRQLAVMSKQMDEMISMLSSLMAPVEPTPVMSQAMHGFNDRDDNRAHSHTRVERTHQDTMKELRMIADLLGVSIDPVSSEPVTGVDIDASPALEHIDLLVPTFPDQELSDLESESLSFNPTPLPMESICEVPLELTQSNCSSDSSLSIVGLANHAADKSMAKPVNCEVVTCSDILGTQGVRQNASETLDLCLPPPKPPDALLNMIVVPMDGYAVVELNGQGKHLSEVTCAPIPSPFTSVPSLCNDTYGEKSVAKPIVNLPPAKPPDVGRITRAHAFATKLPNLRRTLMSVRSSGEKLLVRESVGTMVCYECYECADEKILLRILGGHCVEGICKDLARFPCSVIARLAEDTVKVKLIGNASLPLSKGELPLLRGLKHWQWWVLVALNVFFLIVGQAVAVLLGRFYYDQGGNSKWMATLVQTAAFPILLMPFVFLSSSKKESGASDSSHRPSFVTLAAVYVGIGILIAGANMLYSIGLLYLAASTYSLICAPQLAFNAIFSYFINSQKFTALIANSVVILSLSATLLAINDDSDAPEGVSKWKYIVDILSTLGASALYSLLLSLMQLSFEKGIKKETFTVVLELQIDTSIVAICISAVGLFASGEWKTLHREMSTFHSGKSEKEFVDFGYDLILANDTSKSDLVKEIASKCGEDFNMDASVVVVNHSSYVVSDIAPACSSVDITPEKFKRKYVEMYMERGSNVKLFTMMASMHREGIPTMVHLAIDTKNKNCGGDVWSTVETHFVEHEAGIKAFSTARFELPTKPWSIGVKFPASLAPAASEHEHIQKLWKVKDLSKVKVPIAASQSRRRIKSFVVRIDAGQSSVKHARDATWEEATTKTSLLTWEMDSKTHVLRHRVGRDHFSSTLEDKALEGGDLLRANTRRTGSAITGKQKE